MIATQATPKQNLDPDAPATDAEELAPVERLRDFIQDHPVACVAASVAVGFVCARIIRAGRSE